jgi:hypothetical protein
MQYPLTPIGRPFGFYDLILNETLLLDQYLLTTFWNQTVMDAYGMDNVPGGVFDVPNCATPFVFRPSLPPKYFPDECRELINGTFPSGLNASVVLPFNVTTLLPFNCARIPMPSLLLSDILSDVGAHNLRTAWNLLSQYNSTFGGGLPGTVGYLKPFTQLTGLQEKYAAIWKFVQSTNFQPTARFFPPCNGSSPAITHYQKVGPSCQLYKLQTVPQWIFRVNLTLNFSAGELHPEWASQYPGVDGTYYIRSSWWLIWNGRTVVVQPEADYGNHPLKKTLEKFIQLKAVKIIHRDDSLYRRVGPRVSGSVVVCGQQLTGATNILRNPWLSSQWQAKPQLQWYYPVPSPTFLRTGWTNDQWNEGSQAEITARNFPGIFYWVPDHALSNFSEAECGKVGSVGPCNYQSYSLDNQWGPLYAFYNMSGYARDLTKRQQYPYSSLRPGRSPYLPPLQPIWGDDLYPRAWIASHPDAEINLGMMVKPAGILRDKVSQALKASLMIQVSDRIVNPRVFPLHRRSATDGSAILPVQQIYRQIQNTNATQCLINWYQLSHAWQNGSLGHVINSTNVTGFFPPAGTILGGLNNGYCDPDNYTLPSSVSGLRRYVETWVCHNMPGMNIGGNKQIEFVATQWNDTGKCNSSPTKLLVSHLSDQDAKQWWRNLAIYVYQNNITQMKLGTCYPQLHDPLADPGVVLFRSVPPHYNRTVNVSHVANTPNILDDPFLPAIDCILEVGLAGAGLVAGLSQETVDEVYSFHCNPFTSGGDCGWFSAVWILFIVLVVLVGIAVLGLLIYFIVLCAKKSKAKKSVTANHQHSSPSSSSSSSSSTNSKSK